MSRILIIDCFDSFTFNIHHYLDEVNSGNCDVVRYDDFRPDTIRNYSHVVISPGPGLPSHYPLLNSAIEACRHGSISLLGVCLGLQAIAEHFGGSLHNLSKVLHGVHSPIEVSPGCALFHSLETPLEVGHYHSWVVSEEDFPEVLRITSRTREGLIMSVEHRELPIHGVQFHPESIMTAGGKTMLKNWLELRSS